MNVPIFGIWPPQALQTNFVQPSSFVQSLNVRVGGSDVSGDGSAARPFATPQRALKALGFWQAGVIHMGSGTYTRPVIRNQFGPCVFVGDGGGNPLDNGLVVEHAAAPAAAGTGANVVVGAGFVADAERCNSIQMLSGAAAGQRRTIIDNSATNLVPARAFSPAPAPGDSFQVVRSGIVWTGFGQDVAFVAGSGRGTFENIALPANPPALPAQALPFIYFVNIAFDGGGLDEVIVADSSVAMYGVEQRAGAVFFLNSDSFVAQGADGADSRAANLAALLGQASPFQYAGYTLAHRANTFVNHIGPRAVVFGFFCHEPAAQQFLIQSGRAIVRGGTLFDVLVSQRATMLLGTQTGSPLTRITGDASGGLIVQDASVVTGYSTALTIASAGPAVRCRYGGQAFMFSGSTVSSSGASAGDCSQGGQLYLAGGVPVWSGAGALDFRVSAAETQPDAFFAALDATLFAAAGNGSIITRIS